MTIGIVGLGLIGGSFAKTISKKLAATDDTYKVLGYDLNSATVMAAMGVGAISAPLSEENIAECDMLLIALYPGSIIEYVTLNAEKIKKGAIVIDLGGVKQLVCQKLFPIAKENGFTFIGGHPMAGKETSGFISSSASLFNNASMILTPDGTSSPSPLDKARKFFLSLGFSKVIFTSPKEHDTMIAFTSQLPHVISSAYVKSEAALRHDGFSAGSFRDLSRVAYLSADMWTELFLENTEPLVDELEGVIERLTDYKNAIQSKDKEKLYDMLLHGRNIMEKIRPPKENTTVKIVVDPYCKSGNC